MAKKSLSDNVVTVLVLIVGLTIVAVVVTKKSNSAGVIKQGGGVFASAIGAIVAPLT